MATELLLPLRTRELVRDSGGHAHWRYAVTERGVPVERTAIIVCDMWDAHWSRGAAERVDAMAPRMSAVLDAARDRGVHIIHAPSDTMSYYADHPSRRRIQRLPTIRPPDEIRHDDPPLPIDASDGGSDTEGDVPAHPWTRQHPTIGIDDRRDVISDRGSEVYTFLRHAGVTQTLIMGVHTNMCILNRGFAIKQMIRWGVEIALVRDLTDAMYNPSRPPYVDHRDGVDLVVGYIEAFWCPTVASEALLR